ncbi:MAG: type I glyceraldehyde-3-phosphate dehydrogenase [Pseudomonadales bacterium]|nr:type I glyceraldehyde-3-phosphate dehydrogenase [Pseudomonadales bacterium]
MIRIGINGYGRIGRCVLRAIHENNLAREFQIVAINDLSDFDLLAHLTEFDSTHGYFNAKISQQQGELSVNGQVSKLIAEKEPAKIPWSDLQVDLVLECTGKFKQADLVRQHLSAGAPKVLVSHPVKEACATIVYGVNHQTLTTQHQIISNASCTTNCLAPVAKVLQDTIGIEHGYMTTIHAYTNAQALLDKASGDYYRSRAAAQSMIPTKTGAAAAVGLVLPELAGKLDGMAVRVPTANVSLIDCQFMMQRDTSVEEVNQALKQAAETQMQSVLSFNERPLVSIDFNHNPHSSIFDATQTRVTGRHVKVMSWYDNEWGFANRMLDAARYIVSL